MNSPIHTDVVTFLFTDIEGSSGLWERYPDQAKEVLASHDALARAAVEGNRGTVIKMMGGGVYAAFDDALDGILGTLQLQLALADATTTQGVALRARAGLHAGVVERRDDDFFGSVINRAARIMGAAHGGQILVSEAVAAAVRERLPAGVGLRELGSVRLRGLDSAERVFQVVHPQLRQDFPALSALDATPTNLPSQNTSFVGRERESAEIRQLLGETRLLTLLGTIGIGKTRLALQVAADVLDDYRDGVWLVDLEAVSDPRLVEPAVARVLGLTEETNVPPQKLLAAHLASRKSLLVLDHCEHLIEASAHVADALLRAAPELRILATSREALRVDGEQTYALTPMAFPQAHAHPSTSSAGESSAVVLFVDRARAQQPDFALTEHNAPAVASICARLDGIPLAIELAAAWVPALTLEEIDARLANHLALVEVDKVAGPPQQRRLRTMLDRSYGWLDDRERLLFNRISVFNGGFDLDAAEQICGAPPLSPDDVLDLLTALADKSLVVIDSTGERSLFRQYEILRDYARERAADPSGNPGDIEATRERHAEYLRELGPATDHR